jgi:hypothetical protein
MSFDRGGSESLAGCGAEEEGALHLSGGRRWWVLAVTKEEWTARMKAKDKGDSSGRSCSGGGGGRGRGCGSGCSGGTNSSSQDGREETTGRGVCHNYGKMGHWARECRSKAKKGEAHATKDEESSLLLMEVGVIELIVLSPPQPSMAASLGSPEGAVSKPTVEDDGCIGPAEIKLEGVMHLMEDKVFTYISNTEEKDSRRWVLDTGATNHMTGCRSAFSNLDRNAHGTVRFRDVSVVQIEGLDTILFSCKNGEHQAFVGVYYIPKLNTNVISVGQLDEIGFQTVIEGGVMKIRDVERRVLAKELCLANRMYVLIVEIAAVVCLAMQSTESVWLWHMRYGHLNFPALRKIARDGMVRGLP